MVHYTPQPTPTEQQNARLDQIDRAIAELAEQVNYIKAKIQSKKTIPPAWGNIQADPTPASGAPATAE